MDLLGREEFFMNMKEYKYLFEIDVTGFSLTSTPDTDTLLHT